MGESLISDSMAIFCVCVLIAQLGNIFLKLRQDESDIVSGEAAQGRMVRIAGKGWNTRILVKVGS